MAKYSDQLVKDMRDWVATHGLIDNGGAKLRAFLEHFGISDAIHYKWKKEHSFYVQSLEEGKAAFRRNLAPPVVKSLFDRAKGGYISESEEIEDTKYIPDAKGDPTIAMKTKRKVTRQRYIPPDTAAAIFLLTNLDPESWKNKQNLKMDIKHQSGEENNKPTIIFEDEQ